MKETFFRWAAAAAALALGILFAAGLLVYAQPMEARTYDLSLSWEGEAMPEGWVFSDKGWTVFTQEGADRRELEPNGVGGYTGLSFAGQTIYFSRVLEEALDAPTLQIAAAESAIAVFLDGTPLYADFDREGAAVGGLDLPTLEGYRAAPVTISLPADCRGGTLTIAQATPVYEGVPPEEIPVYPAPVTLFCGYAYESGLIAQSFQTAVPAALCYGAGVLLLALLVWQAVQGRRALGLLWAALALFFWMAERLGSAPFFYQYFGGTDFDLPGLARFCSLAALLAFLADRGGRRRWALWALTGLYGLSVALRLAAELGGLALEAPVSDFLALRLPVLLGFGALLAALGLGAALWRRESRFYRLFLPLTGAGALLIAALTWASGGGPAALAQMDMALAGLAPDYLLWRLMAAALAAAALAAGAESAAGEIAVRAELRALADRERMALASYESLARQQEEILMLRHDMTKQLRALQGMVTDPEALDYLNSMAGRVSETRSLVSTGNRMLDILLNSRLTAAQDGGIPVELQRTQAPERLPLSNTELCSLIMNILDNAVEGAGAPGVARPYIKLDLHIRNRFFVFVCENAATRAWMEKPHKKEPMQTHGLGTKIIQRIMARHGNLIRTEKGEGYYRVTLALPLTNSEDPAASAGPPPPAGG